MPIENLLFVDTNIWLDFYRARNEMGLRLLERAETQSDKMVVNFQLESEFKRNRQRVILEGMAELKSPGQIPCLGIFSDAKDTEMIKRHLEEVEKRAKKLKKRLSQVLEAPTHYDPVYKVCQKIFHKKDGLNLQAGAALAGTIRRRAWRRYTHGYPPRKSNDTSMGDAFNWEWMVHCATENRSNLVIVSRDADYGVRIGDRSYTNDHLRQEFSDKVGRRKKLKLFSLLSEALKLFHVTVSVQEEQAENALASEQRLSRHMSWDAYPAIVNALSAIKPLNYNFLGDSLPDYSAILKGMALPDYSTPFKNLAIFDPNNTLKAIDFRKILNFVNSSDDTASQVNSADAAAAKVANDDKPDK